MSKLSKIVFATVFGLCVLPQASAAVIQYEYSASVISERRGDEPLTPDQQFFSIGDVISGSFTYDNGVSSVPDPFPGTIYFALSNLLGSINGNSFSDPAGIVGVLNDYVISRDDPNSYLLDYIALTTGSDHVETDDLNGFSIVSDGTTFELVVVRLYWFEVSYEGFLEDESLLGSLPPVFSGFGATATELEFVFVDVNDENNTHIVRADSLVVTAVPVPAAIWMFLGAIGLLGAAGSRGKTAR